MKVKKNTIRNVSKILENPDEKDTKIRNVPDGKKSIDEAIEALQDEKLIGFVMVAIIDVPEQDAFSASIMGAGMYKPSQQLGLTKAIEELHKKSIEDLKMVAKRMLGVKEEE